MQRRIQENIGRKRKSLKTVLTKSSWKRQFHISEKGCKLQSRQEGVISIKKHQKKIQTTSQTNHKLWVNRSAK
jgi:hypothetical protein